MTSEVVVLVPTLRRPGHVAHLLRSFRASDTPGRLLFIVQDDDPETSDAVLAAGGQQLVVPHRTCATWPAKINAGYRVTTEPWILCAADDVRFWRGWFQATAVLRADPMIGVIATNDMGNPRVKAGDHATHPLVRRQYADEQGTIDGPGAICSEAYRHWCVDDELCTTAKARGAFASCASAVVEHLHPYWRKGSWDDTYALGESSKEADQRIWHERAQRLVEQCESRT